MVSSRVSFISHAGAGGSVGVPGGLAGDSGVAAQLSRAGSPSSRIRVGGYLGFAGSLNTALRGNLGNALVMQVRAQRPSYWVGETFDTWQGESWMESPQVARRPLREESPFILPATLGEVPFGQSDLQTFYVSSATADLVFHAESAHELWFPTSKVYVTDDGTVVSPIGLGTGSIYTVDSQVSTATPAELRADDSPFSLAPVTLRQEEQLPHPYPRVLALARSVTAGDTTTYGKVQSLIHWIGAHTHYSTNIPPLPAGADTVDEFLFGNRVGFCEQISTSLAVMLRSLGIPAREAVGYVPGGFNPITDLYQVHAERRPRLGPGVVPRLRVAGLRPDGGGAAQRSQPRRDRAAGRRHCPAPHPPGAGRPGPGGRRPGRHAWCAGAAHARRRGQRVWRAASSAPDAAPAGHADRARPCRTTPPASTSARAVTPRPGAAWPPPWRRAPTEATTRPPRSSAPWPGRPGGTGWVPARAPVGDAKWVASNRSSPTGCFRDYKRVCYSSRTRRAR